MAGTTSTPVFVKDAQYLSLVADNDITIGNVVKLTSTGSNTCDVGSDTAMVNIGVAVGGDRFSRTQTDNLIEAGNKVTVCTRGIVRAYTGTSSITRGTAVEAAANGVVEAAGTGGGTGNQFDRVIGIALDGNDSAATTIRVALMRL